MKIKVKAFSQECKFDFIAKGEWIDLRSKIDIELSAPQAFTLRTKTINGVVKNYRNVELYPCLIPLGVAMQLPKGYEAHILPRSSTVLKFGILCGNSQGIVDSSYCGDNDEWKFSAVPIRETTILKGERICQFRIQLSQKATVWQKIKWLFTRKIEFVWVNKLDNEDRGGFGSTGKK